MTRNRRQVLLAFGTAGSTVLAGCSSLGLGNDSQEVKDSDGDGVIDSEDYAPRDPDVQRADQVQEVDATTATESDPETPATPASGETLANFEDGLNGFEILIGDETGTIEQGDDANAERTTEDAYNGEHSLRFECSKNGGNGSVVVRRGGIDTTDNTELEIWSKLVVGNTYGNPRIQLYAGATDERNRVVNYFLRDYQEQGVWERLRFNIDNYDTLRIDIVASSGAAAPQEALVDYIRLF